MNMNLFVHCLGADVRRFWPVIAGWLLVVAGMASIDGIRPHLAADPRLLGLLGVAGNVLWLAQLLMLFLLIALVVQAHPLVGSEAFWMTRPIPPATLLACKLTLLGIVMVAAPAIAEIVLMAVYRVPAKPAAFVAVDVALTQAAFLILLMTAAALTRNLPGFALLCGSAIGLIAIALSIAIAVLMARDDFSTMTYVLVSTSEPMPSGEDPTAGFLWNVLLPAIGLAVLAVQYRSRSRVRASALGVAGVLLASAIVHAWPWPVLAPRVLVPDWARAASALRLSADPGTVDSSHEQAFARRTPWRLIRARVHLNGIESGWSATAALMNASIQMSDGSVLPTERGGFPADVPVDAEEESPQRLVMRKLLGVGRVIEPFPPKAESAVVFVVRDVEARGSQPRTGEYRGRFQVALTHHEIEATLPLRAGAGHQSGAYRFVLDSVDRARGGAVALIARESRALSRFDRRPGAFFRFYLRNQSQSSAIVGNAIDVREVPFLSRFMPLSFGYSVDTTGFFARGLMISFAPTAGIQGESMPINDAWIAGAELVIVRTTREGSVQRELDITEFPIG
jgi:hypothetical protein